MEEEEQRTRQHRPQWDISSNQASSHSRRLPIMYWIMNLSVEYFMTDGGASLRSAPRVYKKISTNVTRTRLLYLNGNNETHAFWW